MKTFLWYPSLWGQNQDNWDLTDPTSVWLLPLTSVPWLNTNPYIKSCYKHSCPQWRSCHDHEGWLLSVGWLSWLLQPEAALAPLPTTGCWKLLEDNACRQEQGRGRCPVEEGLVGSRSPASGVVGRRRVPRAARGGCPAVFVARQPLKAAGWEEGWSPWCRRMGRGQCLLSSFTFISSGTSLLCSLGHPVRMSVPIKYSLWDSKPLWCPWWVLPGCRQCRARCRQRGAWWHGAWSSGHARMESV